MESFDEVVTTPDIRLNAIREFAATMSATDLFAGRYHVVATSGTTGNRGFFVFTKDEWRTLAMASVARGLGWSGHDPRASGRGVVSGVDHSVAHDGARRRGVAARRSRYRTHEPRCRRSGRCARREAERLSADDHDGVPVGHADPGRAANGRPTADRAHPHQCTSEVLTADAREAITHAFGVVPANLYAASECGGLAASCAENDGLHLSEDLLIVENVDESDRPVPEGAMGAKTLVTVLANHTLPLIRYELSDRIVIEPSACACGKPYARIREVGGRQGDVVRLPGRDGADVTIAPAQITTRLRGSPVKQWQLRVTPDGLSIACVCEASEFQEADVLRRLGALLTASGAQSVAIRATQVDRLERTPTGKGEAGHDADALTSLGAKVAPPTIHGKTTQKVRERPIGRITRVG